MPNFFTCALLLTIGLSISMHAALTDDMVSLSQGVIQSSTVLTWGYSELFCRVQGEIATCTLNSVQGGWTVVLEILSSVGGVRLLAHFIIIYMHVSLSLQAPPTATPPEVSVEDRRVQDLLTRLTCVDFDRVFAAQQEPLTVPKYKLMTEEQLKQVRPVIRP